MGTLLKVFALVLVIGGLWIWISGKSVTRDVVENTDPAQLSASVALVPAPDSGAFDQTGTIVLDMTQGQGGTPYILYTDYNTQGKPSVKTKRLVFQHRDACADVNLPCATNQPGVPVRPDENVRVIGIVKNELVEVLEIHRL
jgi:hypothetical protein